MRIVITGGAGFIGSNLAELCRRGGHDVAVIDDLSTGQRDSVPDDVRFVEGSILDVDALESTVEGAEAVVHLAAVASVPESIDDPIRTNEVNVRGTLNVLQAAKRLGVRHVSVASSSAVYGANKDLPQSETSWIAPLSPYAVSKAATEQYAFVFAECYGLPTTAFRFFNVYGPGQSPDHIYAAVIPAFVDRAIRGEPLVINGDGLQTRDFIYVETVCSVLLNAALGGRSIARPINLALGARTTLVELIAEIGGQLGRELSVQHGPPRAAEIRDSLASDTLLRSEFDITPVSLREGLAKTITWHQTRLGMR